MHVDMSNICNSQNGKNYLMVIMICWLPFAFRNSTLTHEACTGQRILRTIAMGQRSLCWKKTHQASQPQEHTSRSE